MLQRVVAGQLQTFLDGTSSLDPFQTDFRPHHWTETALVTLLCDPLQEANSGSILLDLSAAIDSVTHGILLNRLLGIQIRGTALR